MDPVLDYNGVFGALVVSYGFRWPIFRVTTICIRWYEPTRKVFHLHQHQKTTTFCSRNAKNGFCLAKSGRVWAWVVSCNPPSTLW